MLKSEQICANLHKYWNNVMSNDGWSIEIIDQSHGDWTVFVRHTTFILNVSQIESACSYKVPYIVIWWLERFIYVRGIPFHHISKTRFDAFWIYLVGRKEDIFFIWFLLNDQLQSFTIYHTVCKLGHTIRKCQKIARQNTFEILLLNDANMIGEH